MLSPADVVLIGYYGRANFGDDVLMTVAHGIARKLMPDARVALRIGTSSTYPERLIGSDIERIPFGTRDKHRLILHGGGGTFFDFQRHGIWDQAKNELLFVGGTRTFVRLERIARGLIGKARLSGCITLGMGLGIGTFTKGSPKLRDALPILSGFDALWVRDGESVLNLSRLGVTPPLIRGSDLAFLWEYWCPPELVFSPIKSRPKRPRIGVILRDWPVTSVGQFARDIRPVLKRLAVQFELTVVSLDRSTDGGTLTALKDFPQIVWDPAHMTFGDFSKCLAAQDVLLTSRAHGAICGACLGRAAVILGIEPKLRTVYEMLPNATRFVSSPFDPEMIVSEIEAALAISIECISSDALANREASLRALAALQERVDI